MENYNIKMEGDRNNCVPFVPVAKNIGEQLYQQWKATGQSCRKEMRVSDVTVRVECKDGYVDIWIEDKANAAIDVISGMTDKSWLIDVATQNGGTVKAVNAFYPASIQQAIEKKPRAWRNEQKIATPAAPVNVRASSPAHDFAQTGDISPAMYTGLMRHAAQVAMGVKGQKVYYEHTFYKSHGIYMDGTTAWLIEISADNGILAKKLTGAKKATTKLVNDAIKTKLPIIPDGKAFPANIKKAIQAGTVRQLAKPEALTDFYSKSPFYYDCGWAFSDSGIKAVNTCWDWPDNYKRGYKYNIIISGGAGRGPTSATVSMTNSGYLFCAAYYHGVNNPGLYFPVGDGDKVYSFDAGSFGVVHPNPAETWSAPVFAYYVGEEEKEYGMKLFKNLRPARAAGWQPFDPTRDSAELPGRVGGLNNPARNLTSQLNNLTPLDFSQYNIECEYSDGYSGGDMLDFYGPGIISPEIGPSGSYQKIRFYENSLGGACIVNNPYSGAPYATADSCSEVLFDQKIGTYEGKMAWNKLAISPKNRCSVFVARFTTQSSSYDRTTTKNYAGTILSSGTTINFWQVVETQPPPNQIMEWKITSSTSITSFTTTCGIVRTNPLPSYYQWDNATLYWTAYNGSFYVTRTYYPSGSPSYTVQIPGVSGSIATQQTPTDTGRRDYGPASSIVHTNFNGNQTLTYTINMANSTELNNIYRYAIPSPDDYQEFTKLASGQSAFYKSSYGSKYPYGTSASGYVLQPKDSEDMSNIGSYVSWVGYE